MCQRCGLDRDRHEITAEVVLWKDDSGTYRMHGDGPSIRGNDEMDADTAAGILQFALRIQRVGEALASEVLGDE